MSTEDYKLRFILISKAYFKDIMKKLPSVGIHALCTLFAEFKVNNLVKFYL
jgi:hypothetical protein